MRDIIEAIDITIVSISAIVVMISLGLYSKVDDRNIILCKKIYTTELRADEEIKQICDSVAIPLSEVDKIGGK